MLRLITARQVFHSKGEPITRIENGLQQPPDAFGLASMWGVAAYLLVVSVPALLATFGNEQVFANGIVDYGVTLSGIIAYTMISLQFVLAARIEWIEKPFGFPAVLRFHKTMAVVATLFVFVHMTFLVWSRGNWNLILNPWASWPIQLGRVAVVSLLTIIAISFGRRLIPINNSDWRWFHNALAWLILILGFVHSMVMGTSFENPMFAVIWTGYFAMAFLAWTWRRYFRSETRTKR